MKFYISLLLFIASFTFITLGKTADIPTEFFRPPRERVFALLHTNMGGVRPPVGIYDISAGAALVQNLGNAVKAVRGSPHASESMVVIGNSIALHSPSPDIEWFDNNGMAAPEKEKDFSHLVAKGIGIATCASNGGISKAHFAV